eukprot:1161208-Pelagomonas_calceolata.AAC.8
MQRGWGCANDIADDDMPHRRRSKDVEVTRAVSSLISACAGPRMLRWYGLSAPDFCVSSSMKLPHRAYSQQSVSDAVTRTVPRDIVAAACPRIKTLAEVKHSLRPGCLDLPPNKRLSSKLKLPKSQASSAPNA